MNSFNSAKFYLKGGNPKGSVEIYFKDKKIACCLKSLKLQAIFLLTQILLYFCVLIDLNI